jgi:hypothetical protein
MATTATFSAGSGLLTEFGDAANNSLITSRDSTGRILGNNGAVPIVGGTATIANTSLIQAFGLDGNDTIALDETTARFLRLNCLAAMAMTRLPAVQATMSCSARPARTPSMAGPAMTFFSEATARTC